MEFNDKHENQSNKDLMEIKISTNNSVFIKSLKEELENSDFHSKVQLKYGFKLSAYQNIADFYLCLKDSFLFTNAAMPLFLSWFYDRIKNIKGEKVSIDGIEVSDDKRPVIIYLEKKMVYHQNNEANKKPCDELEHNDIT